MFQILFYLLLIGGISTNKIDPRIYHGFVAEKGQFPWQAALYIPTNNNLRFCGGAVINEEWILTAAHCLRGAIFSIRVLLGTTISTGDDPDQLELHSKDWQSHPEFDPWSYEADLGLVKLPQPINFTDYIKPLELGIQFDTINGTGVVSGWGSTGDEVRATDLRYSEVDITDCDNGLKVCSYSISGSEAQNICGGDSGGALVVAAKDGSGPVHIGVASTYSGNCAEGQAAAFTFSGRFADWIDGITGIELLVQ